MDGATDVKTIQGSGLGIHVRWMIRRDMAEVVGSPDGFTVNVIESAF